MDCTDSKQDVASPPAQGKNAAVPKPEEKEAKPLMSPKTIEIVKATTPAVGANALKITQTFYKTMFKNNPEAGHFFNKSHQHNGTQQNALADAVVAYASNIDNLGVLGDAVTKIAHRHVALSVLPEHYPIVHSNMMKAIGEVLGDAVTEDVGGAWSEAVMALAKLLIEAEEQMYKAAAARKGGWRAEREFKLVNKETVADDTIKFTFAAADGYMGGYEFTAGQYITVRIPENTTTGPRHYTITSLPNADKLSITCRLVKGGVYSTHMHNEMKVGDKVLLGAPSGVFVPQPTSNKGVLISAGIGVTPMWALFNFFNPLKKVAAVCCVEKSEKRLAFKTELETACGKAKIPFTTKYTTESRPLCKQLADDLFQTHGTKADYYICGPVLFMSEVTTELERQGAKVYTEVFGTGSVAVAGAAAEAEMKCPYVAAKAAGCPYVAGQEKETPDAENCA